MSVLELAFPYNQDESDNVILNKFILTDINESNRMNFELDGFNGQRKCVSVYYTNTKLQQVISKPLSYIDNVSGTKSSPLLIKCDANFKYMKFNLSMRYSSTMKSLVVVKTSETESLPRLIERLQSKHKSEGLDISQIRYSDLDLKSVEQYQQVIINDEFDNQKLNATVMNVYLFQNDGTKYTHLFDFALWINEGIFVDTQLNHVSENSPKATTHEQHHKNELQISDYRNAFNFTLHDGPDFRKVLTKNENQVPSIQKNISILMEELKNTDNALKNLINSQRNITSVIGKLANFNPILMKFKFKQQFHRKIKQLYEPITTLTLILQQTFNKKVLDKIKSISTFDDEHNNELSSFRKNFDSNSKDYYNWLKKYLSNEKDKLEQKLLTKRKIFELSKFDYLNYLNNFTNNQYMNELFEGLFKFISQEFDIVDNQVTPTLNENYKIYLTVLLKFNAEKFKLRQMIESCKTNDELSDLIRNNNLTTKPEFDINDNKLVTANNVDLIFSPTDTESPREPDCEKVGILYALGGKGKQGWHKEWVVIQHGELLQYSDWRNGSELINKPIQIALCNVKPSHHDKRLNCFEITTSTGTKFVFQALNNSEATSWIKTIENSRMALHTEKLDSLHSKHISKFEDKTILPVSEHSHNNVDDHHIKQLYNIAHSGNDICADCGSNESVDWVSMNFLVILCINCSSCHRNMGSHISKIKSLALDNFTKETLLLLGYVNNNHQASYLEANLKSKPSFYSYDERLGFIRNKYIDRQFAVKANNANDELIKAIGNADIPNTIKYISLGADPNCKTRIDDSSEQVSLFEYSLQKYTLVNKEKYFIISEYLLLNGVKIEKVHKKFNLTPEAYDFWQLKYAKLMGIVAM